MRAAIARRAQAVRQLGLHNGATLATVVGQRACTPVALSRSSTAFGQSLRGFATRRPADDDSDDDDTPARGGAGGDSASGSASEADKSTAWMEPENMTPSQVVSALSKHIIGQEGAKRAISIALRNRWRRMRLPQSMQDEIIPKNILMVGPTGCGKTEIARRLAKLCRAPFVKVEATKFTEVGYHGRDVDSIIKDLMDASLLLVKELKMEAYRGEVGPAVEAKIIEALTGPGAAEDTVESFRALLREGQLDDREIVVDVPLKERGAGPDMEVSVAGAQLALSVCARHMSPSCRRHPSYAVPAIACVSVCPFLCRHGRPWCHH